MINALGGVCFYGSCEFARETGDILLSLESKHSSGSCLNKFIGAVFGGDNRFDAFFRIFTAVICTPVSYLVTAHWAVGPLFLCRPWRHLRFSYVSWTTPG